MPADTGVPDLVRHCVRAVAGKYGGDTKKAFAICVAQLQGNGYLKPGSMELTAKGREKEKEHEGEPDADGKLAGYERLLKANRKGKAEGSVSGRMLALLREGRGEPDGGRLLFTDVPGNLRKGLDRDLYEAEEDPMARFRRLAGIR